MAKYRLKRKTFGVVQNTLNGVGETVKNTAGGVMEGVGKAADTKTAGTIGGLAGAWKGFQMSGNILGGVAGYIIGKAGTRGLGRGLKNAGQDLQS